MRLIAIDPGDVHVGLAMFDDDNPEDEWRCRYAIEASPDKALDDFALLLLEGDLDFVIWEQFRLYADKAMEQTGSEMLTSQMIGVIRYLLRCTERHRARYPGGSSSCPLPNCKQHRVVTAREQPADIKTPTLGLLRARGIQSKAKQAGTGGHALDAETHGWCFLIRNGYAGPVPTGRTKKGSR